MTVESTTQALCDLALRFGEGDEESMVILPLTISRFYCFSSLLHVNYEFGLNFLYFSLCYVNRINL